MFNHLNNSRYEMCDSRESESWVPTASEYFLGTFGNLVAMVLIWVNRQEHNWTGFYRMLTALVITDFLGVFCAYPLIISRYISDFTYCMSTPQCEFLSFVLVDAHLSAALLICAMSFDRLLVLLTRPERLLVAVNKYNAVILIIWLLCSVVAILPIVGVGSVQMFYPGSWCYFDFLSMDTANHFVSYFYSILAFMALIGTLISNIVIIYKLCFWPEQRNRLRDANLVPGNHEMVFIVAIIVTFLATCTPFFVNIFLHATGYRKENGSLMLWFERLAVLNAIIDPWLYIVLRKESIQKLIVLFRKCCRRTEEDQETLQ